MIKFGKITALNGPRVDVRLTGYESDAEIPALLMQPCGVGGPSVWLPPSVGDTVVVAYDETYPENSVVLGCIYPDGANPPKTGASEAAIEAGTVYLGSNLTLAQKCPRDDRLQIQLAAIKAELDAFVAAFNAHTHLVLEMKKAACAAIVAGATSSSETVPVEITIPKPPAQHAQTYVVGQTDSDSVWVV